MALPRASRDTMAAVAALTKIISQEDGRKAFRRDPEKTMKDAGFDLQAIPQALRDHLRGMSPAELRVLAETCDRMIAAGLYINIPRVGRVCFF